MRGTSRLNRMRVICRFVAAVVVGLLSAAALAAPIKEVKINWEVGTYTTNLGTGDVTYKDAHLKLATRGTILTTPAPTLENNGFTNGQHNVVNVPGPGDDTLTIDWNVGGNPPLVGKHHLGGTFSYDTNGNPLVNDVKILEAFLTGATAPGIGITGELARLDVPGPTGFRDKRSNSVDWEFLNNFPIGSPAITYSNIEFYKTAAEPALSDLTAANFPSLGATFLQSEPDFVLPGGGPGALSGHFVHVTGVDVPEWIIAVYTTSWVDPVLSTAAGSPVTLSVDQWAATNVVPEPATLAALLILLPAVRRRRID